MNRQQQIDLWTPLARSRSAVLNHVDTITQQLIIPVKRDMHVVDLACGTGNPSFACAERVGEHGCVAGFDITPAMIAEANATKEIAKISNVDFVCIPSSRNLPISNSSIDVVTCRYGLMFMDNLHGILREILRILVPGGTFTFCVHEKLPALRTTLEILSEYRPRAIQDLRWQQVFSLSNKEYLRSSLSNEDTSHITLESQDILCGHGKTKTDAWMDMFQHSPAYAIYTSLPKSEQLFLQKRAIETTSFVETAHEFETHGSTIFGILKKNLF